MDLLFPGRFQRRLGGDTANAVLVAGEPGRIGTDLVLEVSSQYQHLVILDNLSTNVCGLASGEATLSKPVLATRGWVHTFPACTNWGDFSSGRFC